MSDERMIGALGRLEQALLRAEAAGAAMAETSATRDSLEGELARMAARHERLRAGAASAIARLDGLIAPADAEAPGG